MLVCEADKTEWKSFATAKPPDSPAAERAPVNAGSFEFPLSTLWFCLNFKR